MPDRAKLTTQASEECVPTKKRAASGPAGTLSAKRSKPREKVYNCTHAGCEKAFARPCRLEEHLRSHTGERPYKCTADPENCDKSFLRGSHLKAHVKALHLKDRHIKCTFMITPGKEDDRGIFGFKRRVSEPNTPRENIDSDEEAPRQCGAGFTTNQQLKRHMESHMKEFPHVCSEYPPCSAGFRKRGPLRRHIRSVHLNLLPWGCPQKDVDDPTKDCTAAFDTRGRLGSHINTIHNRIAPARYTCAMCIMNPTNNEKETGQVSGKTDTEEVAEGEGEVLSRDKQHTSNEPMDHNLDPNQDLDLGTSTPFPIIKSVLVADSESGATPDPETARLQGRMGFKTYLELRKHTIQMHPPTCNHCGYTCKSGVNLKHHIKNSHGAGLEERKEFACDQCDTSFTKKYNLKVHIRCVHENLRLFKCTHAPCTKAYGYKADLRTHIGNKHSDHERKPRKPRGKSTKKPGLIAQLTGVGYENSGRNIECVVEGCLYRFCRMYDLKVHLGGKAHGFDEGQVEELMIEAERIQRGDDDETEEDSEMEWDGSSGSGSDEDGDGYSGLGYADLWDSMSDRDLDREAE